MIPLPKTATLLIIRFFGIPINYFNKPECIDFSSIQNAKFLSGFYPE